MVTVSRGFAMVRFQQSTQTFNVDDVALMAFMLWFKDSTETLPDPLMMAALKILGQGIGH